MEKKYTDTKYSPLHKNSLKTKDLLTLTSLGGNIEFKDKPLDENRTSESEKASNSKESPDQIPVKVLGQNSLPSLGHIDYCLFDKTGTLTTANFRVKALFTKTKFYNIDMNILKDKIKGFRPELSKTGSLPGDLKDNDINPKPNQDLIPTFQEIGEERNPVVSTPTTKPYKFKQSLEKSRKLSIMKNETNTDVDGPLMTSHSPTTHRGLKVETDSSHILNLSPLHNNYQKENMTTELINVQTEESLSPDLFKRRDIKPIGLTQEIKLIKREEYSRMISGGNGDKSSSPGKERLYAKYSMMSVDNEGDNIPNEIDYFNDCSNEGEVEVQDFTRALAICHNARSKHSGTKHVHEYTYESPYPDELALLELGALSGKTFLHSNRPDNPSKYTVKEGDPTKVFKILGVNDFSYSRKRFSIVSQIEGEEDAMIYVKGSAISMKSVLRLEENEAILYESIIKNLQNQGYKVVIFAGRKMQEDEAKSFHKKYQSYKMSLYSQNDEFETLANEVEAGLQLIGIVALEDELRADAREVVKKLKDADIKVWMLTGDNQENATNVANLTKMITPDMEIHSLRFDNVDDGKAVIRNVLNTIKKHFKEEEIESPTYKYATLKSFKTSFRRKYLMGVTIDGDSLDIILADSYLAANFAFICALSTTVIGYKVTPNQKRAMALMAKKRFHGSPTIMAIGDGQNDKLMLQIADVGLELRANDGVTPNNAGDIQITCLKVIPELLFVDGRDISRKLGKTVNFMFYKSVLIGVPIFLSNIHNQATGAPLFDSVLVFLYSFLFSFFPIIFYGILDKGEPREILLKFPALYLDGRIKKYRAWIFFLVHAIIESAIHGIIVFEIVMFAVQLGFSRKGHTSDLGMASLVQYYSIVIISSLKVILKFNFNP